MTLQNVMDDLNMRFIINCPQEELSQLERVFFQIEQAHWFYDDFFRATYKHLPHLGMKDFSQAFVKRCPSLKVALGLPDDGAVSTALNSFTKYKHKVPVCGVIMVNSRMTQCVLVKGWIAGSAWGFPKGKMNADEPTIECAVREVVEETSFDATNYIQNPEEDFIERTEKGQTLRLYIARDVPTDFNFVTQTRKEISDIKWFDVDAVAKGNLGGGDKLSGTASRCTDDLVKWIKQRQPEGSAPSNSSKRSRKKKDAAVAVPTSSQGSQGQAPDAQSKGGKGGKGKRRGSKQEQEQEDVTTFGDHSKGWSVEDMFAVNETKFGIVNSFNYDEYTVPLPDAATQARAMEEYRKNQAQKGRSRGSSVDHPPAKVSPNLQPLKQQKSTRRHSVGGPPGSPLAPSVANIFAMAQQQQSVNTPNTTRPSSMSLGSAQFSAPRLPPATTSDMVAPSCAAHMAPTLSFAFNTEEILSCI